MPFPSLAMSDLGLDPETLRRLVERQTSDPGLGLGLNDRAAAPPAPGARLPDPPASPWEPRTAADLGLAPTSPVGDLPLNTYMGSHAAPASSPPMPTPARTPAAGGDGWYGGLPANPGTPAPRPHGGVGDLPDVPDTGSYSYDPNTDFHAGQARSVYGERQWQVNPLGALGSLPERAAGAEAGSRAAGEYLQTAGQQDTLANQSGIQGVLARLERAKTVSGQNVASMNAREAMARTLADNANKIDVQGLVNRGGLDVQRLTNEGGLAVAGANNQGAMARATAENANKLAVQGLTNQGGLAIENARGQHAGQTIHGQAMLDAIRAMAEGRMSPEVFDATFKHIRSLQGGQGGAGPFSAGPALAAAGGAAPPTQAAFADSPVPELKAAGQRSAAAGLTIQDAPPGGFWRNPNTGQLVPLGGDNQPISGAGGGAASQADIVEATRKDAVRKGQLGELGMAFGKAGGKPGEFVPAEELGLPQGDDFLDRLARQNRGGNLNDVAAEIKAGKWGDINKIRQAVGQSTARALFQHDPPRDANNQPLNFMTATPGQIPTSKTWQNDAKKDVLTLGVGNDTGGMFGRAGTLAGVAAGSKGVPYDQVVLPDGTKIKINPSDLSQGWTRGKNRPSAATIQGRAAAGMALLDALR